MKTRIVSFICSALAVLALAFPVATAEARTLHGSKVTTSHAKKHIGKKHIAKKHLASKKHASKKHAMAKKHHAAKKHVLAKKHAKKHASKKISKHKVARTSSAPPVAKHSGW